MSLLLLLSPTSTVAISLDATGSANGDTVTGLTIDITSATVGAWCYCWMLIGRTEASVTFTGWTQILGGDEAAACHYGLWRRKKQSGDTTFAASWPLAEGASAVWVSYNGLHPTSPDEQASELDHSVSGTSFVTPTLTPLASGRWSLALFGNRGSSLGSPVNAFTTDAALTDRVDAQNTVSSHFMLTQAADSNAVVAVTALTYTDTLNHSSSSGASALLFLVPGQATAAPFGRITIVGQSVARATSY